MKKVHLSAKAQTFRSNVTLNPDGFGGWFAQNIGDGNIQIDGYVLEPLQTLDFSSIASNVLWSTPIAIVLADQANGALRLTRFYTEEGV